MTRRAAAWAANGRGGAGRAAAWGPRARSVRSGSRRRARSSQAPRRRRHRLPPVRPQRVPAALPSPPPARGALGRPGQCPRCGPAAMATKIDKEACRAAYNLVRDDGSAVIW
ncbi:Coactosin-like protein [Plecturocebus cupreus]